MNVVEKILARKSGHKTVAPGDVVTCPVDLMVMHDLSASFVIKVFEGEMPDATIAEPSKIVSRSITTSLPPRGRPPRRSLPCASSRRGIASATSSRAAAEASIT